MNRIIHYMFQAHLVQGVVTTKELLDKWQDVWPKVSVSSNLSEEGIVAYLDKGHSVLINLVTNMADSINVLDVNVPWQSDWKVFNLSIVGTLPAFTTSSIEDENDRKLFCIDTILPYVTSRNTEAAMQIYSLAREALTQDAHTLNRPDSYKMQLIDPTTGVIKTYKTSSGRKQLPIIGAILQQMKSRLCLPNYHSHCNRCPYKKACDTKYLSNTCLNNAAESRAEIESKTL